MAAIGVDTRFATPGHAQSDGASERAVQSIRDMLRALAKDANALSLWKAMLPRAVFSYNASNHSTTGRAPFYMSMLRIPRSFLTSPTGTRVTPALSWMHSTKTTQTALCAQAPAALAITTSTVAHFRTWAKMV